MLVAGAISALLLAALLPAAASLSIEAFPVTAAAAPSVAKGASAALLALLAAVVPWFSPSSWRKTASRAKASDGAPVYRQREAGKASPVPQSVGMATLEEWNAKPKDSDLALPLESEPLTLEQEALYEDVFAALKGQRYGDLPRFNAKASWLRSPDMNPTSMAQMVHFEPREVVQTVRALYFAGFEGEPLPTCKSILQFKCAYRRDHGLDGDELKLDLSAEDMRKCRELYPKVVFGTSKPYGYPILWDRVTQLQCEKMQAAFGSVESACEKILWYDLHIMELFARHKERLSKERGVLLYKGMQVIDLGAWKMEHLHPALLTTVQKIIARSGEIWPECVWSLYLINVPWVFLSAWNVIKRGCHPVTLEKVHMYSESEAFFKHLTGDLGVSPNSIPMEYGGEGPSLAELPIVPSS